MCYALTHRAASQVASGLLDVEEEDDKGEYNEEIIYQCTKPMPNQYFGTDSFLEAFENQCNQVSWYDGEAFTCRVHFQFGASSPEAQVARVCFW